MNRPEVPWLKFWDSIEIGLANYVASLKHAEVNDYLRESLAFFSYYLEDVHEKFTLHKEMASNVFPMIVQLHDLLRSNVIIQNSLMLTSAAASLRTSFEIRINLKYIYKHREPKLMLQRLSDFAIYEEHIGRRKARPFSPPSREEEEAMAQKFPFWCKKDGTLKENAEWNGEDKTAKDICESLGMENHYFTMYKLTSKFIHGSPLVKNMYSTPKGFHLISSFENVGRFSIMSTYYAMHAFADFLEFFGVPFDIAGFNQLQHIPMDLQERGEI